MVEFVIRFSYFVSPILANYNGAYVKRGTLYEVDPVFATPGSDFHLQATSPLINAAGRFFVKKDIEGTWRGGMSNSDIGAYEYK